jgi:hypothetical protein
LLGEVEKIEVGMAILVFSVEVWDALLNGVSCSETFESVIILYTNTKLDLPELLVHTKISEKRVFQACIGSSGVRDSSYNFRHTSTLFEEQQRNGDGVVAF